MSDEPVRSYQRIFRPDRRLYQIDGRPIPVPGGVPLRWLAYAIGVLLAVVVLSGRSSMVIGVAVVAGGLAGAAAGGRETAAIAAIAAGCATWGVGFVVSTLDWPLRLVVLPALVATVGTQATPDGRRSDRFALSWMRVRLMGRRSLGRPLPAAGQRRLRGGWMWVAPDERAPTLRRARVRGPATLHFAIPALARPARRRRLQITTGQGRPGRRDVVVRSLELQAGEVAEVRP